jgi:hypothetical protein
MLLTKIAHTLKKVVLPITKIGKGSDGTIYTMEGSPKNRWSRRHFINYFPPKGSSDIAHELCGFVD